MHETSEAPAVERMLCWFDPKTDALIGEEPLAGIDLQGLQELFEVAPDDPMFDVYSVEARHVDRLQQAVRHVIDRDRYFYSVHAYASE
jgi:hypothetical protein